MKLTPLAMYALLGAAAALLFGKKGRRRKGGTIGKLVKGAALGAAVSWGAPRVGIQLPQLGAGP